MFSSFPFAGWRSVISSLLFIGAVGISSCSILPEPVEPATVRRVAYTANTIEPPQHTTACTDWYNGSTGEYIGTTGDCSGGGGGNYPDMPNPGPSMPSYEGGYNPGTGGVGSSGGSAQVPGDTPELQVYEGDYRTRMSTSEIAIYDNMTRKQQVAYLLNAQQAEDAAARKYPGDGLHNGPGDAFRHALFSANNAIDLGLNLAKQLGDAHENQPQDPLERQMDLYNNQIGRNLSQQTNFIEATVSYKVDTGGLLIIKNGMLVPSHP